MFRMSSVLGDKVEGGLQLSLTDSNDEKNENISELVTRKDLVRLFSTFFGYFLLLQGMKR